MYCIYFAKSLKNNKVYVGYSQKKPEARIVEHNQHSNKWTTNNGPFKLMYYETYLCKEDAQAREKFYKTGIGKRIKKAIVEEMSL